ncbi:MAG: hypothetical protein PVSMB7_00700 [Chloroflexota bacterium]
MVPVATCRSPQGNVHRTWPLGSLSTRAGSDVANALINTPAGTRGRYDPVQDVLTIEPGPVVHIARIIQMPLL